MPTSAWRTAAWAAMAVTATACGSQTGARGGRDGSSDLGASFEMGAPFEMGTLPREARSSFDAGFLFADEFNGTAVDTSLWDVMNQHGDTSNSEPECYTPANTVESGGFLAETVKAQSYSCPCSGTVSYTSGAVQMKSLNFTYGTVEVRAKLAGGTGPWPAIWMLGANCQQPTWLTCGSSCNWPAPGSDEIDIAEILSSNHGNVNQQIHSTLGNPGCYPATADVSANWHVYTLVWQPGSLVFEIDGATTCTLTGAVVPSHPMFLILNLAVGGNGGGTIDDATLPQTSTFDYVHIRPM